MKINPLYISIAANVILLGFIFWPTHGLYFENEVLSAKNEELKGEVLQSQSRIFNQQQFIDSIETAEIRVDTVVKQTIKYYEKKYEAINKSKDDTLHSVVRGLLEHIEIPNTQPD